MYLALGQSKKALPDLGKVVELKPDFHQVSLIDRQSHPLPWGKGVDVCHIQTVQF